MKIKEFLGMLVLDSNANEVGKIVDAEFDKETGKLTKIGISLRKNILSSSVIEVDFDDIKSIGDYVLLNIDIDKEAIIKEKEAKEEVAEEEAEEEAAEEEAEVGDNMSFCDLRGETIDLGAYIRYAGTGTVSQVVDLKEEDNKQWVKLEEPSLWYAADTLEVIDESDINSFENEDRDTLEKVKDLKDGLTDITEGLNDIQGCEGGG